MSVGVNHFLSWETISAKFETPEGEAALARAATALGARAGRTVTPAELYFALLADSDQPDE